LADLAPISRQSGKWRGKGHIQDHPVNRIGELKPWEYYAIIEEQKADAETQSAA
jgi:hypothetical protein